MPDLDTLLAHSMSALLSQTETRNAIVEYIKSLTEKNRPTEQWREVWWEQSSTVRIDPKGDPNMGLKNRKCRLLVMGFWDARQGIGNLRAYNTGEADYKSTNPFNHFGYYDWGAGNVANDVFKSDDYIDVIVKAREWFRNALDAWYKVTEPLPEETKE